MSNGKALSSNAPNMPKAWMIANMEDRYEAFTISDTYLSINERVASAAQPQRILNKLTPADQAVRLISPGLVRDEIGGEDFRTLFESGYDNGAQVSLHGMVLGPHGGQKFHYHPPDKRYPESARRFVLLYPLWNDKTQQGGIEFSWFDTEDTVTSDPENELHRYTEGVPVAPKYEARFEPGQVVLLRFGKGIHRFFGDALALSGHFLDIDKGSKQGSFMGNTSGWRGEIPEGEGEKIQVRNGSQGSLIRTSSLQEMWVRHSQMFIEHLQRVANDPEGIDKEHPISKRREQALVRDLRY